MELIKASLKNPYMVVGMGLMILVVGILAMASIPIDILPMFKASALQVLTYFHGMPPSSVEKAITNRIACPVQRTEKAPGRRKIRKGGEIDPSQQGNPQPRPPHGFTTIFLKPWNQSACAITDSMVGFWHTPCFYSPAAKEGSSKGKKS